VETFGNRIRQGPHSVSQLQYYVVVNDVGLTSEVNQHWARLILRWVTVFGRVNHLDT